MKVERTSVWHRLLLVYFVKSCLHTEHSSDAMTSSSCPPSCECDVSRKYITCFEYIDDPLMLLFPNDTRQLEIRFQKWTVINASIFTNLVHLRKLQLSSSFIENIVNDFANLQKLKRLDLRDNMLCDSIFNTIGEMKQLKELILDKNNLKLVMNNTFNSLEHIELLSLSGNQIEIVPSLRGLEEVQKLFLSENFIRTVNRSTFSNLYKLEELYLDGNLITQMEPGWSDNLRYLRHLDLSENVLGLQTSRNVVGLMRNIRLEILSISKNSLVDIPCLDISKTKHLIQLILTYNNISTLANDCLNKLKLLQILDLKGNQIESIEEFALQDMSTLEHLLLQENYIQTLPPYWLNGSRIGLVDLSFNDLVYISKDSFSGLQYLEEVILSKNRISSISSEAFCDTSISVLMLSFNKLQIINEYQFQCAVTLTVLALNNNCIQEINPAALSDVYLIELYLHSNLLETITENLVITDNYTVLTLRDNPWMCDCRIRWMLEYIVEIPDRTYAHDVIEAEIVCAAPNPFVNDSLLYFFSSKQLMCSSFPSPLTIRLILGISISIIGIVVSVNVIKLYCRYRELEKYGGESEKTHAL